MNNKIREERFKNLLNIIKKYPQQSIALYGTGNHTKILLDYLDKYKSKIRFLLDRNIEQNYKFNFEVKLLEDVKDEIKAIIISSDVNQYPIYEKIKEYKNSIDIILIYSVEDFIIMDEITYEECRVHWQDKNVKLHTKESNTDFYEYSKEITDIINLKNTDRILDVGCANGKIDYFMKDNCKELMGFDFSETLLKEAVKINPECTYWNQSFLDSFKYKNFDKIFSYGVIQYCKPNDIEKLIINSIEAINDNGKVFHLAVPDKALAYKYYKTFYSISKDTLQPIINKIKIIYEDGSYWYDMEEIKRICFKHNIRCQINPESVDDDCYRSNIILSKNK